MDSTLRSSSSRAPNPSLLPSALPHRTLDTLPSAIHVTEATPVTPTFPAGMSRARNLSVTELDPEDAVDSTISPAEIGDEHLGATQSPIQPFFTLIEDATSGTHHHPTIHYIFSDEDSEALMEATHRVEQLRIANEEAVTRRRAESRSTSRSGPGSTLKPPIPTERYIVVQLAADGTSITSAHSLTSDWQILDASVSNAPMLNGTVGDMEQEAEQSRLMLKIEGIGEIDAGIGQRFTTGDGTAREMSIDDEVRGFAMRMAKLSKIVERAERDLLVLDTRTEALESAA